MVTITDGTKTVNVPEGTANAVLKEKWMKHRGWSIVEEKSNVPLEVVQFQKAKQEELRQIDAKAAEPEIDLSKLPVSKLEEIAETLTEDQLKAMLLDSRKSVKLIAKRQITKLRNAGGK
jgi:hypothetical protein